MPKCGQLRVGAAWVGGKEPDLLAPGRLRFYDKRCRTRIIMGAQVRAHIAKNSIFRVQPGNGFYGTKHGRHYQHHYKYFKNIGAPGSNLAAWQAIFRQVMNEVKLLPEPTRDYYRGLLTEYVAKYKNRPGTYRAREWPHFYVQERLKALYPGYP